MKIYHKQGFKLSYPDGLKVGGESSTGFELINPKTKVFCGIQVEYESWSMEYVCNIRFRSAIAMHKKSGIEEFKVLRDGTLPSIPGSVESLYQFLSASYKKIQYNWGVALPIDGRIITVFVAEQTVENIDNFWKPIIENMTFSNDGFMGLTNQVKIKASTETYNWKSLGLLKKAKQFQHTFNPENAMLSFYDSSLFFLPEMADINAETVAAGIIKKDKNLILLLSDALDIETTFFYDKELPDLSQLAYERASEGIIGIDSGKLCVQSSELPEVEIIIKPGNYRFLICYKAVEPEEDRQKIMIWFCDTKDTENNQVKTFAP